MVSRGTKEEYYKPGQNMLHKVKNYSKIGQDFKNVISNFYLIFRVFLTDIVNINFWNEDWALLNV